MQNASESIYASHPTEPPLKVEERDGDRVELAFTVDPDLFQLQGHFPGKPVLPGVAQIDWAVRFARRYLGMEGDIIRLGQLKFSALILGGSEVRLRLDWRRETHRLHFSYHMGEETCSSGFFELAAQELAAQ